MVGDGGYWVGHAVGNLAWFLAGFVLQMALSGGGLVDTIPAWHTG